MFTSKGWLIADRLVNPLSKVIGLGLIAWGGFRLRPELGLWLLGGGLVAIAVADEVLDFFREARRHG